MTQIGLYSVFLAILTTYVCMMKIPLAMGEELPVNYTTPLGTSGNSTVERSSILGKLNINNEVLLLLLLLSFIFLVFLHLFLFLLIFSMLLPIPFSIPPSSFSPFCYNHFFIPELFLNISSNRLIIVRHPFFCHFS